jgi:formamidopyrimidine-DNA glycosylase
VPELPEVETLRRDAEAHLVGRRASDTRLLAPDVLRAPSPAVFRRDIVGASFRGARRRAKHLLLDLDSGQVLALQLAIFGQLLLRPPGREGGSANGGELPPGPEPAALDPDTLLVLGLADGASLDVLDRSHYTRITLATPDDLTRLLRLDELGPEPLDPAFTAELLAQRLGARRAKLKALLLDQKVLAGLGNIYVDEALWRARLHPARPANSLTAAELRALHKAIQQVLYEAVEHRGTTFHTYRDLLGEKGRHQDALAVFHRQGDPCPRCGATVERVTVASRDTHLCPRCQPPAE